MLPAYPVPQNTQRESTGMNVLNFPKARCSKATDVSPVVRGLPRRIKPFLSTDG